MALVAQLVLLPAIGFMIVFWAMKLGLLGTKKNDGIRVRSRTFTGRAVSQTCLCSQRYSNTILPTTSPSCTSSCTC